VRSENRIDQRMPLELVTDSFLPSEQAQGVTSAQLTGKKMCCSGRKLVGNDQDKISAVNQAMFVAG
jgi:hypothetical protein